MLQNLLDFLSLSGFAALTWQMLVMWVVVFAMLYLAVAKKFEPLLLVPIAFGAFFANLPTRGIITMQEGAGGVPQPGLIRVEAVVETETEGVAPAESEEQTAKPIVLKKLRAASSILFPKG